MKTGRQNVEELTAALSKGELTRREFVTRVSALGLSGGAIGTLLAACQGGEGSGTGTNGVTEGQPKRGGRLRVGLVGGGSTETLDPNLGNTNADIARTTALFDKLFDLKGPEGELTPVLAESMEPDSTGEVWTLRLKPDVEWHDGKAFSVDDVVYTFSRVLDPDNPLPGSELLGFIDLEGLEKVDPLTLRMKLKTRVAEPTSKFTTRLLPIIQDGATSFDKPVGTGPFQFSSFTPGERSLFTRFENYHGGDVYLDELEYVNITDQEARVSALQSGQVDVIESMPAAQAAALGAGGDVQLKNCQSGGNVNLGMRSDRPPFDDVRVRQAFRLMIDREQIVQNAFSGFARVGNDLPSPFDPNYNDELPQREHDPDQARALLQAAGQEGLRVTLESSTAAGGMLETAQVFAEQAGAAGVTVEVRNNPADTYYNNYGKPLFFQDEWGMWSLDDHITQKYTPASPYNPSHFQNDEFTRLWEEARTTLDDARRKELYFEAQRILWEEGADIIWGFSDFLTGFRSNVMGLECSPVRPVCYFQFHQVWLA